MTAPAGDAHLRKLVREAVADLAKGDPGKAKWSAVFAGGELERMARETGGAVEWPAEFATEPLKGWAEYGVELARRAESRKAHGVAGTDLRLRPGTTHAAHAVGND